MPYFMALVTNEQITDAVNASMNGAREALILALTVMEAVINLLVDIYRSTLLCFLELVVRGGLSLIIGATQEINTLLTNTFSSLRTSIQNDVAAANSAVQTAIDGINKVNPFGNIKAPQFSIPSLDALQNVTLPTVFQDSLTKLNASLPSVSVLKDTINNLLDTPFEAVKKDINDTFASMNFNSLADSAHPLLMRIANKLSALLRLTPSQHVNPTWFFHYIFHPPALGCFLIGFFGILSVQLQLLAVTPLEAKFHDRANAAVSDFSGSIFTSLNQSMYNQSALYANGVNNHINSIQSTVNDGLFGWVNGTTTTLNDAVNTFYSDLQSAVSAIFNGEILEQPAQEFFACFIGSKVDAIENTLTFLHDNLNINVLRENESALVLSPEEVNAASQPIAAAAIGNNNSPDGGLVGRLINTYFPLTPAVIHHVDSEDPESFDPSSSLKHRPTKSFDSFFNHVSPASAQPPPLGIVIHTLSRKLRGDGDWHKRLTLSLWGDKSAACKRKSFPELENASLGISRTQPPSYEPKSTWSPDTAPTSTSVNPGACRKPSMPMSAMSAGEADSNALNPVAVALAHVPMPLHYGYGYARAAPACTVYFPPSPSAALARVAVRVPVPAQNPFSTPFDDEAGVEDFSFMPLGIAKEPQAKFVAAGSAL
ncbi:hypothetical protein H4582DRAFT_2097921 [Lactarius indigo]|nr:hypothetical protein H4582DRAFT_2097921 [Lactarius indigo]